MECYIETFKHKSMHIDRYLLTDTNTQSGAHLQEHRQIHEHTKYTHSNSINISACVSFRVGHFHTSTYTHKNNNKKVFDFGMSHPCVSDPQSIGTNLESGRKFKILHQLKCLLPVSNSIYLLLSFMITICTV